MTDAGVRSARTALVEQLGVQADRWAVLLNAGGDDAISHPDTLAIARVVRALHRAAANGDSEAIARMGAAARPVLRAESADVVRSRTSAVEELHAMMVRCLALQGERAFSPDALADFFVDLVMGDDMTELAFDLRQLGVPRFFDEDLEAFRVKVRETFGDSLDGGSRETPGQRDELAEKLVRRGLTALGMGSAAGRVFAFRDARVKRAAVRERL
jgi:hypothetical protein